MPPERFIDLKKAAKAREQRLAMTARKAILSQAVIAGRDIVNSTVEKITADNEADKRFISTQVYAGTSSIIARRAPSLYNAVIHHEAKNRAMSDNNEGREALPNLSHEIAQSNWRDMPAKDRDALISELEEDRSQKEAEQKNNIPPGVITRDFNRTVAKLEPEIINMSQRTGSEYLVFFLRGGVTDGYSTHVLTSPKVSEACGALFAQTPANLALKFEAFCVAGLAGTLQDIEHHNRSTSQGKIREAITKGLHEILRQKGTPEDLWPKTMQYVHYEKLVAELGVHIVGWPEDKMCSITEIDTNFRLTRMIAALKNGHCRWEILSDEEWKQRKREYKEKVDAGKTKQRATRKDKGTTRKGKDRGRTRSGKNEPKSKPFISDSDSSQSQDSDEDL